MKYLAAMLAVLIVLSLLGCGAAAPEASGDIIDTEYFTFPLLPGVHHEILPNGDRYAIAFYELQDYEASGTGLLCTLKLFKEGEDYTLPGHVAYGVLETKTADFQVVALYPTETTYTPANAKRHKELQQQLDNRIIYDLTPKKGIQYLRPTLENAPISEVVIETQYYTVKMPEEWVGKCTYSMEEFADGTSIVTFYENESYMAGCGGKLCGIQLVPEQVDWWSVEDASLFGSLKTPDGLFYIVGIFPWETQCNKQTYETYEALRALTPALFDAITPKEGCELIQV